MPAPTALLRKPDALAEAQAVPLPEDDDELLVDANGERPSKDVPSTSIPTLGESNAMHIDEEGRPRFAPIRADDVVQSRETRRVAVAPHRMTPLKNAWDKL